MAVLPCACLLAAVAGCGTGWLSVGQTLAPALAFLALALALALALSLALALALAWLGSCSVSGFDSGSAASALALALLWLWLWLFLRLWLWLWLCSGSGSGFSCCGSVSGWLAVGQLGQLAGCGCLVLGVGTLAKVETSDSAPSSQDLCRNHI